MNSVCYCPGLDSGNFNIGYGGPKWSPYAQAIADQYEVIVPSYQTVQLDLAGTALERKTVLSDRAQFDQLIFGAHISDFSLDNGSSGQQVFMNVDDLKSSRSWVTPTPVGNAPLSSFGGIGISDMPILELPEAFFLPSNTRMRHAIFNLTNSLATGGAITWIGAQLLRPKNGRAPSQVTLSNGKVVNVGWRAPLFASVGLGRETYSAGDTTFVMTAGSRYLHYTPPINCDCEIHDVHINRSAEDGTNELLVTRLIDVGDRSMWSPNNAPINSVMGEFTKIYPAAPFPKPYILKKGHRLQISVQNNNAAMTINDAFCVIRGVRLCEY